MQPLPTVYYNSTDLPVAYQLANATAAFYYQDSKQRAEVVGDDILYLTGGKA